MLSCHGDGEHEWHHQRRTATRWTPRGTNPGVPQSICAMGRALQDRFLGGELTHLGKARVVLAFSVHRLIGYRCMINASGQLTIDGNIPFSEVAGAWYQTNAYKWERLLVDSGGIQLVRSIKEPPKIATIVLSRGLPEHCSTRSAPRTTSLTMTSSSEMLGGSRA